jgi:hypothetical protein
MFKNVKWGRLNNHCTVTGLFICPHHREKERNLKTIEVPCVDYCHFTTEENALPFDKTSKHLESKKSYVSILV